MLQEASGRVPAGERELNQETLRAQVLALIAGLARPVPIEFVARACGVDSAQARRWAEDTCGSGEDVARQPKRCGAVWVVSRTHYRPLLARESKRIKLTPDEKALVRGGSLDVRIVPVPYDPN